MMLNFRFFIFLLAVIVQDGDCAKILGVFTFPSKSHYILSKILFKELVKRGHEVVLVSPYASDHVTNNYTEIQIPELLKWKEEAYQRVQQGEVTGLERLRVVNKYLSITDIALNSTGIQNLLKSNRTFDLMIQVWAVTEALLGLAYHYDVPVVAYVPLGGRIIYSEYVAGTPQEAATVPVLEGFGNSMTFWERLLNTYYVLYSWLNLYWVVLPAQETVIKRHFPDAPSLENLLEKVDLMLLNSDAILEYPRVLPPNIINIGGFHLKKPDPLPKDLQTFLDDADEGVIYFSFGSNIKCSGLPTDKLEAFREVFQSLNMKVLWKFENESMFNGSTNIKFAKWLPQMGILAHPNVKLFITHGGLGSLMEALYNKKPVICIPFFHDQGKNCEYSHARKTARQILLDDLNKENLANAINNVLQDPIYKHHVEEHSDIFLNQPQHPLDRAMFWIEHVIRHKGAKHMKLKSASMPWYQAMLWDVVFVCLGALLLISIILYLFARKITYLLSECVPENKLKTM